jgi:hypothetical protein
MGRHVLRYASASAAAGLALGLLLAPALAGSPAAPVDGAVNTGYFGNLAIRGYDPVAYFTESRAVEGSPDYSYDWLGATWQFANASHREMFVADPISYAPQYGGFCAGGASIGETSGNIDPEAWRIVDGKLYIFGGPEGLEEEFDPNTGQVIAAADAHWPEIAAGVAAHR